MLNIVMKCFQKGSNILSFLFGGNKNKACYNLKHALKFA